MVPGVRANCAADRTHNLNFPEREAALKNFQETRDKFLKSIAGLSPQQWTFKSAPDRWSVAEVSEHIAVSSQPYLVWCRRPCNRPRP